MTISDLFIPGKVKKEIIVHTYTCHPSMAINEISGPLVVAFLAKDILNMKKKYFSYRFIFAPETIGSITYLKKNGKYLKKNLIAGFICTCVGHNSSFTYKRSKLNNSITNIAVEEIFKKTKVKSKVLKFSPSGSDERQYCSIGYNLPIGSLMRVPYGKYKEYHTSLDNKDLISFNGMYETINMYKKIFNYIEKNYDSLNNKKNYFNKIEINLKKKVKKNMLYPVNLITKGEPFLTKHKIRYSVKNHAIADKLTLATKWLIHYSDGKNSLYDISRFSKLDLNILKKSLKYLLKTKIFKVNNSLD